MAGIMPLPPGAIIDPLPGGAQPATPVAPAAPTVAPTLQVRPVPTGAVVDPLPAVPTTTPATPAAPNPINLRVQPTPAAQTTPTPETPRYDPNVLPTPEQTNFFEEMWRGSGRGWEQLQLAGTTLNYILGLRDQEELIANMVFSERTLNELNNTETMRQFNQDRQEEDPQGIWDTISFYARHPTATISQALSSLISSAGSIVTSVAGGMAGGSVAGGPVGAAAGGLAGLFAGDAVTEFGLGFWDYARTELGVDTTNPDSMRLFLSNPDLVGEAMAFGGKRGVIVAALDTVGALAGGAIARRFILPGATTTAKVGGTAAGMAVGASAGSLGEFAAQVATGQPIDQFAIWSEGILDLGTSAVTDVAIPVLLDRMRTEPQPSPEAVGQAVQTLVLGAAHPTATIVNTPAAPGTVAELARDPQTDRFKSTISYAIEAANVSSSRAGGARMEQRASVGEWLTVVGNTPGVGQTQASWNEFERLMNRFAARDGTVDRQTAYEAAQLAATNVIVEVLSQRDAMYSNFTLNKESLRERARTGRQYFEFVFHSPILYNQDYFSPGYHPGATIRTQEGGPRDFNETDKNYPVSRFSDVYPDRQIFAVMRAEIYGDELRVLEIQSDINQAAQRKGMIPAGGRPKTDNWFWEKTAVQEQAEVELLRIYPTMPKELANRLALGFAEASSRAMLNDTGLENLLRNDSYWTQERTGPNGVDVVTMPMEERLAWTQYFKTKEFRKDVAPFIREGIKVTGKYYGVPRTQFVNDEWISLAVGQAILHASDMGLSKLVFPTGEMVQIIQNKSPEDWVEVREGLTDFYEKKIAGEVKKWAARLGPLAAQFSYQTKKMEVQEMGPTSWTPAVRVFEKVPTLELTPLAASHIKSGLPARLSRKPKLTGRVVGIGNTVRDLRIVDAAKVMDGALKEMVKKFQFSKDVDVIYSTSRSGKVTDVDGHPANNVPSLVRVNNGKYEITIFMPEFRSAEEMYVKFAHELGHVVLMDKWHSASPGTQLALQQAFDKFLKSNAGKSLKEVLMKRENAITLQRYGNRVTGKVDAYWIKFEEWFAEQTAKWATTSERPLSVVEKYFRALGHRIRNVVTSVIMRITGAEPVPEQAVREWLDSFMQDVAPFQQHFAMERDVVTKRLNQAALKKAGLDPEVAAPWMPSTIVPRKILKKMFKKGTPADVAGTVAMADKMHWGYRLGAAVWQLARANPRLRPLQMFSDATEAIHRTQVQLMARPYDTIKQAQKLSLRQQQAVSDMFEDYHNYTWMSDAEYKSGSRRRPNPQELQALAKKNGLNDAGLVIFGKMVADLDWSLDQWFAVRKKRVMDTTRNPLIQAEKLQNLDAELAAKKQRPWFPVGMRYGRYPVIVYDKAGNMVYADSTDSPAKQKALAAILRKNLATLGGDKVDDTVIWGRDVAPLAAVYAGMAEDVQNNMETTLSQQRFLKFLTFDENPASLFRSKARMRSRAASRGQEFFRLYSNYFASGARFQSRLTHMEQMKYAESLMQRMVNAIEGPKKDKAFPGLREDKYQDQSIKLHQIRDMMQKEREYLFGIQNEWTWLRSVAFFWHLGFNVASAMLNLSQIPIFTTPFLADKFGVAGVGDLRAMTAVTKAAIGIKTTYRRPKALEQMSSAKAKALGHAIKIGRISEAMAAEFAGLTEGVGMKSGFGGNVASQTMHMIGKASAAMFTASEAVNRRVTFRAAWDLANKHPDVKYIEEAVNRHPQLYDELRTAGWSEHETRTFLAAIDVVDQTQGKYTREARAKFLRGKAGSAFFVFYSFPQQMLMTMWHNKGQMVRSLFIISVFAGLMGLPGAEDMMGLIKRLAQLFGVQFDPETEARKYIVDVLGAESETADTILHGVGRQGFGIPTAFAALGMDFVPSVDRSASVGFGRLSPVDFGEFLNPNTDAGIANAARTGAGASLGIGFQLLEALMDQELSWGDTKRIAHFLPTAAGNVMDAVRIAQEGGDRTRVGGARPQELRFDRSNPMDMAEIIAIGLGYQPTRVATYWDNYAATREAASFWDIRREMLLQALDEAVRNQDDEGREDTLEAIRQFNEQLPDEARGKALTRDTILNSLRQRAVNRTLTEQGLPTRTSDYPIYQEIDRLYPIIDQRTVR